MNREFVKKLIKSEILRYEAVKEILPGNLKNRVEAFEKEAAGFIRDLAMEMLSEGFGSQAASRTDSGGKKSTKRVDVDFSQEDLKKEMEV